MYQNSERRHSSSIVKRGDPRCPASGRGAGSGKLQLWNEISAAEPAPFRVCCPDRARGSKRAYEFTLGDHRNPHTVPPGGTPCVMSSLTQGSLPSFVGQPPWAQHISSRALARDSGAEIPIIHEFPVCLKLRQSPGSRPGDAMRRAQGAAQRNPGSVAQPPDQSPARWDGMMKDGTFPLRNCASISPAVCPKAPFRYRAEWGCTRSAETPTLQTIGERI